MHTGANIRLYKKPAYSDVEYVLQGLYDAGARRVALNTFRFVFMEGATIAQAPWDTRLVFPDEGQDPDHPWHDTTPMSRLRTIVHMAFDIGFEVVVLKPMIDLHYRGGWRGSAILPSELADRFFRSYKYDFLNPHVPLLKECEAVYPGKVHLCFGTETVKLTEHYGPDCWIDIARWLRWRGVRNPLTYASNWGWEMDAEYNRNTGLYRALDTKGQPLLQYVSINLYPPMCDPDYTGPITRDLLLTGAEQGLGWHRQPEWGRGQPWLLPVKTDVVRFLTLVQKPLSIMEIGYPNTLNAAKDPAGNDALNDPFTLEVSTPLWEAARIEWEAAAEAWYVWLAGRDTVTSNIMNVLDTPLEDIVWGPTA